MSKRVLVEAQQKIGAGLAAAQQLVGVGGIDADLVALLLQRGDGLLEMRERRVRQATEIDHIGAALGIVLRALDDGLDRERGGIDDLGEDLDVVFGHVGGLARPAEILRDVLELVGPAQERHAETLAQAGKIGAAAAGQHDLVGLDRLRQAARDDVLGHQGRDLDADIQHLPVEARLACRRARPRAGDAPDGRSGTGCFQPWSCALQPCALLTRFVALAREHGRRVGSF